MLMFRKLFERNHALVRQRSGPLAKERGDYLLHLACQGMARRTLKVAAHYLLAIAERLRLATRSRQRIGLAEIKYCAHRWGRRTRAVMITQPSTSRRRFIWHATQWLQFMGQLEEPPQSPKPHAKLVAAFGDYMRQEQGLSPRTIAYRTFTVQDFLTELKRRARSLRIVSARELDQWLVGKVNRGGYARSTIRTRASTLRSFFRYAEQKAWCREGLANTIKSPRCYSSESLPLGPAWREVRQLLSSLKGDHASGIRDRAIILLLAVYGLRAGEVAGIRLEDFDWERELLRVRRPKQRKAQEYPLVRSVGNAVIRYLREVRPDSQRREVFLTCRAPFRPLHSGTLWPVVARRLRGLSVELPHYGPHSLRHACATRLLNQGLSLKEIGDHLGHTNPDTTRIYAKVDLAQLREVGQIDLRGLA
jgi:site-specific recombinase XerD